MITKHPAFQHLLKAALHAKVESYAPPTPYALAGPLLQSAYADMAARGQAWIKEEAKKRGLSFLLDGWSNRRKQALFNCVLAAEGGRSHWLSTVSAVGKTKTKGYMTDLILDQLRPLGSSVVLVVMDGALKCTPDAGVARTRNARVPPAQRVSSSSQLSLAQRNATSAPTTSLKSRYGSGSSWQHGWGTVPRSSTASGRSATSRW
eukprot:TRINITY_DN14748_c0_g1_i2.p2 TRINITY_DN14748_c0_g1~~TRINITY_DN14748_c0_g1_i2.p2  ORF type:complete len:205 (-),score=19.27 TRINITY_DN14748_c0_g1_i2:1224-1838(-)